MLYTVLTRAQTRPQSSRTKPFVQRTLISTPITLAARTRPLFPNIRSYGVQAALKCKQCVEAVAEAERAAAAKKRMEAERSSPAQGAGLGQFVCLTPLQLLWYRVIAVMRLVSNPTNTLNTVTRYIYILPELRRGLYIYIYYLSSGELRD